MTCCLMHHSKGTVVRDLSHASWEHAQENNHEHALQNLKLLNYSYLTCIESRINPIWERFKIENIDSRKIYVCLSLLFFIQP